MNVERIEVPTGFEDFSDFIQSFVDRADQNVIVLPSAVATTVGSRVDFRVLLADGQVALSGAGDCVEVTDYENERDAEYRFDLVIESLAWEGASSVMFERILMARNGSQGEGTGEFQLDHVAHDEDEIELGSSESDADEVEEQALNADGFDDENEATMMGSVDQIAAAVQAQAARKAVAAAAVVVPVVSKGTLEARDGRLPSAYDNTELLTRPVMPSSYVPVIENAPPLPRRTGRVEVRLPFGPLPAPPRPQLRAEDVVVPLVKPE